MTEAALIARLKKEFAAEDYFTGVLGNRASAFKPRPKPMRPNATAAKKSATAKSAPALRRANAKVAAR